MNVQLYGDLPRGIQKVTALPSTDLDALWNSIILNEDVKTQLLSQAVLNFSIRKTINRQLMIVARGIQALEPQVIEDRMVQAIPNGPRG